MKKTILLFCCLSVRLFAANAEEKNKTALQLDMKREEFCSILGEPKKISVREHISNNDWDLLCYEYDGLDIYVYRTVNAVGMLYVYSDAYNIQIDGSNIQCGETKREIEGKFGAGTYDGKDETRSEWTYYYTLPDFREMQIFYNGEDIVVGIFYGYINPD